jgi:hypothetical protein
MGNLEIAQALVFEPRKAFAELAERPKYWFPLLLLIISLTAVSVWYLSVVDLAWMMDQQLRSSPRTQQLSEEQIAQVVSLTSERRGLQIVITGIFTPIAIGIVMLLLALLSLLAAKVTNVQYGYRHWFSLTAWTSLPTVLAQIASALVLLSASTAQISQADLQPLSLNSLLFHREAGTPGYAALTYINVMYFWSTALTVLAVKQWSRRSWLFSFLFSTWLLLLIGGIWAAVALT